MAALNDETNFRYETPHSFLESICYCSNCLNQGRMCDCVCMIRLLCVVDPHFPDNPSNRRLLALVRHHFQCTRGSLISRPRVPLKFGIATCKMERKHTRKEMFKTKLMCSTYILTMLRKANTTFGTCPWRLIDMFIGSLLTSRHSLVTLSYS